MRSQRHLRNNPSPGFFYASCDLLLIYLSCLVHIDFEGHFLGNLLWLKFSKACQVFFTETILRSYFLGWDSILLNHDLTVTDAAGLNTPRNIHTSFQQFVEGEGASHALAFRILQVGSEPFFSFFFIILFIYWLCWLGLCCWQGTSLVVMSGNYSSLQCMGFLLWWLLLLQSTCSSNCGSRALVGSVVVAHGLSCSAACGILPDQGSNPCLLHWQVDWATTEAQGQYLPRRETVASFKSEHPLGEFLSTSPPSALLRSGWGCLAGENLKQFPHLQKEADDSSSYLSGWSWGWDGSRYNLKSPAGHPVSAHCKSTYVVSQPAVRVNHGLWDIILEKAVATHSSVLAWRIPGTEEPGGLPSMGLRRVGHDWSDLAAAAGVYYSPSRFSDCSILNKISPTCLFSLCAPV